MKQVLVATVISILLFTGCSSSHGLTNIIPKNGSIAIPAKGESRVWTDIEHGSFTVTLTNSSPNQSVELYKVKSDGIEKWISPSLLANSSQEVTIPADGHLFIKNFNPNTLTITYKIAE